jgi:hypothetical protein
MPEPYPNLPVTLSPLFLYDGNILPTLDTYSTTGMTIGYAARFASNHAITTDATAPIDPSAVLQRAYPAGLPGGTANGILNFWGSPPPQIQVDEYYEATWFKITGANFEGPGTGQWKLLGFWAVANAPGGYPGILYQILSANGTVGSTSAGVLANSWIFGFVRQGTDIPNWRIDSGVVLNDKWYRMELYMQINTPVTSANGVLKIWLTNVTDGGAPVPLINSTNRQYRSAALPAAFWLKHYSPTWGGTSTGPKTRNDYVHIARTAGFGSAGGSPPDVTPPSTPTGLGVS